jgi:hypothetical protein
VTGAKFVEASSVSGSINIEGSEGCSVRSIDGVLRCSRISGSAQVEIQNGSAFIDQVEKNVAAVSEQGKINVRRVGGRIRLISSKGDIEFEVSGSSRRRNPDILGRYFGSARAQQRGIQS